MKSGSTPPWALKLKKDNMVEIYYGVVFLLALVFAINYYKKLVKEL